MATALPANVHVSKHPCLRAKLSQLRSKSTNVRETKTLVHEIATIVAVDALASLEVSPSGTVSLFFQASLSAPGS
jgi:uracil phosphoribosyltransferase